MNNFFRFRTVLVYDSLTNYRGELRVNCLKAEPVSGSIDEVDLQESINLVLHPNASQLVYYDKLTGIPCRFYRFGCRRRVVVGSDD